MGKATVQSHLGVGQYSVALNFDITRITAELAALDVIIAEWQAKIAGMDPGPEKDLSNLKLTAFQKRKSYLIGNTPSDPTVNIWCADLTLDLSGSVGTIEVPGERGTVIIQPGHGGNAVYTMARDGQLQPVIASPAAQAYFNLAMLPGWQKWMPTHRYGTITEINYDLDTCSIDLEVASSSAQGINVNQDTSLENVPIDYIDCNASAFTIGDDVVIEFTDQNPNTPKVIGFKDHPRGCGFVFILEHGDGTAITDGSGLLSNIKVYNSSEVLLDTTTEWEDPGWRVTLDDPEDADDNGYFVAYETTANGIPTQYPYRYKTADKFNAGDLIGFGDYEDEIPYWQIMDYQDDSPYTGDCDGTVSHPVKFATDFTRTRELKTSVSYRTLYAADLSNAGAISDGPWPWIWGWCGEMAWWIDSNQPNDGCYTMPGATVDLSGDVSGSSPSVIDTFIYTPVSSYTEDNKIAELDYTGPATHDIDCKNMVWDPGDSRYECIGDTQVEADYLYCYMAPANAPTIDFIYEW